MGLSENGVPRSVANQHNYWENTLWSCRFGGCPIFGQTHAAAKPYNFTLQAASSAVLEPSMLHGQPYKQQNPLCISVGGLVVHFRGLKLWYVYAVSCHLTAQNPVNYNTLCALYVQFFNLRCFHIFLAFFNKKQRCRMILDDSVTRKRAGGRRRTETLTYTGFFYTEKSLHRAALRHRNFTRRSLYTEWFLHRGVFTRRSLYTLH